MKKTIDMNRKPFVVEDKEVFKGEVFTVDQMKIEVADGVTISRQLVKHPPVVVMLVHDVKTDKYILEREYRVGSARFAYGVPAGFIDAGETPHEAALRELREETGVVPRKYSLTPVGSYYSSEGIMNELAYIFIVDLQEYDEAGTDFDDSEYINSRWATFGEMLNAGLTSSNSIVALQAEQIRRLTHGGFDNAGSVKSDSD